jgi:hypothetical protein
MWAFGDYSGEWVVSAARIAADGLFSGSIAPCQNESCAVVSEAANFQAVAVAAD